MAKKTELTDRLGSLAKQHDLNRKDYLEALLDMAIGQITPKQLRDTEFLQERYFTPNTYKLFGQFTQLRNSGLSKKETVKQLKERYPRCSKKQFEALNKL